MKVESIKRSGTILGLGVGFALCFLPTILYALIAIDLLTCAITLLESAQVGASGEDHFKHSVHTVTLSRAGKNVTSKGGKGGKKRLCTSCISLLPSNAQFNNSK